MYSLLGYHLDYIFFINGLSFIALAGVCFSFKKNGDLTLPWKWLGLFGIAYGTDVWLDLVAFSIADRRSLTLVRLAFLSLSYLMLLEFARQGIMRARSKHVGIWIYIPLVLGAVSGWKYGFPGLNATVRYCLGFTSGILSAWVICRASRGHAKPIVSTALFTLSIALGLYALTSLVVPVAPFPPASWVNYRWFLSVTGIPIQIVCTVCACICAVAVFCYSQATLKFESPFKWRLGKAEIHIWSACVLVLLVVFGWYFTTWIGGRERAEVVKAAESDMSLLASHLNHELSKVDQVAEVMSTSPSLMQIIATEKGWDLDRLNGILDRSKQGFGMTACYFIDMRGVCFASSNRKDPDSYIGQRYQFRPYVKEALAGKQGKYFALGATSGKKGYYASAPMIDRDGRIIGAAAVKKELEGFEGYFQQHGPSFFIDRYGVVFMSNDRRAVFNCLWPLSDAVARDIRRSQQFGDPRLRPLLDSDVFDGDNIYFQKRYYYVSRKPVCVKGWSLVQFSSLKSVFQVRFFCILITLFICVLVIGFFTALRQRESMLALVFAADNERKTILEAATQVSIITTDNSGLVTTFNSGAERMLGYSAEEVKGACRITRFHLGEELAVRKNVKTGDTGYPRSSFEQYVVYAMEALPQKREWTYVRKDGGRVIVNLSVTPMKNKLGETAGYLFIAVDITELKRAEEALRESELKYRGLFENTTDAIMMLTREGFIDCNQATLRIFGLASREDFVRKHPAELSPLKQPDGKDSIVESNERIETAFKNGTNYFEWIHRRVDGTLFPAEVLLNRLDYQGEQVLQATVRDIAERKKVEADLQNAFDDLKKMQTQLVQSEKMAAVGQLAAGMAHEINNPLAYVMGNIGAFNRYREKIEAFITQLSGISLSTEQVEKVEALKKKLTIPYILVDLPNLIKETYDGTERIKNIVHALQVFAGGERGQLEEVDIVECLGIAVDIVGSRLKNRIDIMTEYTAVPHINGYRTEIVHVFTNLLLNASESVEKDGTITLKTRREKRWGVVEVSDTGRGIPPEIMQKIYDPFFTTKPVGKGAGLGLTIVKGIIERHKGTIEVNSMSEKGTTVIIRLPVQDG